MTVVTSSSSRPADTALRRIRLTEHGRRAPRLPFAVLDVESTGLDVVSDRIIEIAVVRCDPDGTIRDRWSTLVDPGRDPGPTEIHGIHAEDLRGAPSFAEIVPTLREQLHAACFTAHNLPFDAAFIENELARVDAEPLQGFGLCTLELARAARPGRHRYNLSSLAEEMGIPHPEAHRALADATVTAEVLRYLLEPLPTGLWPWPRRRLRLAD